MVNIKKIFLLVLIINLVTAVSAYSWGWGYYNSPLDILESEWIKFALVFVLFFAIVFIALGRAFKENKGAAIAIALAVSFFISTAVARQGWLYSYAGDEIGGYLFAIAIVLGIVFFLKVITSLIGGFGLFITLFGLWYLFSNTNFLYTLPYEVGSVDLFPFYDFLSSSSFLVWTIIALVVVLVIAYAGKGDFNKAVKRWFWNKKKKTFRELLTED